MSVTPRNHARMTARVALTVLAAALGACSTFNDGTRDIADVITLYRPEVVQGNFVSKEQVAALQPGMSRVQVRDVLGTPLVTSVFHGDRWDYVFTMRRQHVAPQSYRLTVFFKGDAMDRFEGDDMPSESEFVQRISRERKLKVPPLQATEDQLAKFAAAPTEAAPPAAAASEPAASAAPALSYPPLEPAR